MTLIWICAVFFFHTIDSTNALEYTIFERVGNSHISHHNNRLTFDAQVKQINRTDYKLTGNITFVSSAFMRQPDAYYHSINFHINTLDYDEYEKLHPVHFPRPTYCEFINTSHRKHIMKTIHSPISSDPYAEDANDDLCYSFRSDHNLHFYIHRYVIEKSSAPPHIRSGLIQIENAFELDESIIVGIVLIVRTERDLEFTKKVAMF